MFIIDNFAQLTWCVTALTNISVSPQQFRRRNTPYKRY
jgi:hypothetical protein